MAEVQHPEGLRKILADAIERATWMTAMRHEDVADAVLTALFEACTVREYPHVWLGDGSRGPRSLVLSYRLPDEPMPDAALAAYTEQPEGSPCP